MQPWHKINVAMVAAVVLVSRMLMEEVRVSSLRSSITSCQPGVQSVGWCLSGLKIVDCLEDGWDAKGTPMLTPSGGGLRYEPLV